VICSDRFERDAAIYWRMSDLLPIYVKVASQD
jgi:hypothetical protein